MVNDSGVESGQIYEMQFPDEPEPVLAEYLHATTDEKTFVLRDVATNKPVTVEKFIFDGMRCDGTAKLLRNGEQTRPAQDIDPIALLDPDDKNITVRERDRRLKARERLKQAETLRYYVMRYDSLGDVGRGTASLNKMILKAKKEAKDQGVEFPWTPWAPTVLRAVDHYGVPHSRPLTAFVNQRGKHDRTKRWPEAVLEAATIAVTHYWSKEPIRQCDAIVTFGDELGRLLDEREKAGELVDRTLACFNPDEETIRNWIKSAENYWTYEQKYGAQRARRQFGGRGRSIQATRALEMVMMDHTRLDVWAVILDEYGKPVLVERPWLTVAIDCYSRMVLGAVFTFEPPSVNSVMECLRQVVRRKDFLRERYGSHKHATDGYGKPLTVIVDNGWEFVGASFKSTCQAANIDVIWAPVKIPMFKAYVERLFGTLNEGIWHRLQGGIPLTPTDRALLDLNPQAEAVHERSMIEQFFWQFVTTIYHVEPHSGIGMAPALKWRKGIENRMRPVCDDVTVLDKLMGYVENCYLTAEGVSIRGQRFHDPATTTQLLGDLGKFGMVRAQRKGVTSSRSVIVTVTAPSWNADHVHVWHPEQRRQIKLPNWDPNYVKGTSWYLLRKIKEYAKKENLAYHSPAERLAARQAFLEAIGNAPITAKFAERRKLAPLLDPRPELIPGDTVTIIDADQCDVPHETAAERTSKPRVPAKSPRRGGAKATLKAVETRARNAAAKKASPKNLVPPAAAVEAPSPVERMVGSVQQTVNAADRLKAIMDRINKKDAE